MPDTDLMNLPDTPCGHAVCTHKHPAGTAGYSFDTSLFTLIKGKLPSGLRSYIMEFTDSIIYYQSFNNWHKKYLLKIPNY